MNPLPRVVLLFALSFEWNLQKVYAGNTICTSNHTNWYTSVIGETPCTTYQRLRQICNVNYQVGTLTRNTPPDHCDDQAQDCCCNSISFSLSMLCLACQDNTSDGFNAGVGAYQRYLRKDSEHTCSGRKERNFTVPIQNAVCDTGIKIEDQLYNLFWVNGQWFYAYTRDSIIRAHATFGNRTQTRCLTTTPSTLPSSTNDNDADNSSQLDPGAIAGIVIGISAIVGLTAIFIILLRRRRAQAVTERLEVDPYIANGTGAASSGYELSRGIPTGFFSDVTVTSTATPVTASKRDRERRGQRNLHPSVSNTNTSTSGSGFGYTSQESPMAVDLGHELSANYHVGLTERHTDAGLVLGTNLSRSDSGRLPPAYGEQISPIGSGTHATEFRPQLHLSHT